MYCSSEYCWDTHILFFHCNCFCYNYTVAMTPVWHKCGLPSSFERPMSVNFKNLETATITPKKFRYSLMTMQSSLIVQAYWDAVEGSKDTGSWCFSWVSPRNQTGESQVCWWFAGTGRLYIMSFWMIPLQFSAFRMKGSLCVACCMYFKTRFHSLHDTFCWEWTAKP